LIINQICILTNEKTRDLLDLKIYVDTDADIRILRRIKRDIDERGRDLDGVIAQYLTTVKPMHEQFVEPTKQYADIVVPGTGNTTAAITLFLAGLREQIK